MIHLESDEELYEVLIQKNQEKGPFRRLLNFVIFHIKLIVLHYSFLLLLFGFVFLLWFFTLLIKAVVNDSPNPSILHNKFTEEGYVVPSNLGVVQYVQASDLHIGHPDSIGFTTKFLNQSKNVIKPEFLVVTGDITNAAKEYSVVDDAFPCPSGLQFSRGEFETYEKLLKQYGFWKRGIDIRGNHDCYGVPNIWNEQDNPFFDHSLSGNLSRVSKTYHFDHGNYRFISADSSKTIGVKHPLNYYGFYSKSLEQRIRNVTSPTKRNILISHYPINCIVRANVDFLSQYSLILSGHKHEGQFVRYGNSLNLGVPAILNGYYRICVFDEGVFAFHDTHVDTWPKIVISAPQDARYVTNSDHWENLLKKNQVRVFAYSPHEIRRLELYIDGHKYASMLTPVFNVSNLYFYPYEYFKVNDSRLHTIEIRARDAGGNSNAVQFSFSVNGHVQNIKALNLDNVNREYYIHSFYIIMSVFLILLLLAPKVLFLLVGREKLARFYYASISKIFILKYSWIQFIYTLILTPFYRFAFMHAVESALTLGVLVYLFSLPLAFCNANFIFPTGKFEILFFWGIRALPFELDVTSTLVLAVYCVFLMPTIFFSVGKAQNIRHILLHSFKFSSLCIVFRTIEWKRQSNSVWFKVLVYLEIVGIIPMASTLFGFAVMIYYFFYLTFQFGYYNILFAIPFTIYFVCANIWGFYSIFKTVFSKKQDWSKVLICLDGSADVERF